MNNKITYHFLFIIGLFLFRGLPIFAFNNPPSSAYFQLKSLYEVDLLDSIVSLSENQDFLLSLNELPCDEKGKSAHIIGNTYYLIDEEYQAIKWFKKAVFDFWKECPSTEESEVSNTLYNIGIAYQYTEEPLLGKAFIDTAFTLIHKLKEYPQEQLAFKYHGAGNFFAQLKDFSKAETLMLNALELSYILEPLDAFYINIDLLSLYTRFSKFEKAKNLIAEINEQFVDQLAAFDPFDQSLFLLNSAEIFLRDNEFQKVIEQCNRVLEMLPDDESDLLSNANEILGHVYLKKKEFDKSRLYFNKAYQLRSKEKDVLRANEAKSFALENLAEVALAEGNKSEANKMINESISANGLTRKFDKNNLPVISDYEFGNEYHLARQLLVASRIRTLDGSESDLKLALTIHTKIDSLIHQIISFAFMDEAKLALLDNLEKHQTQAIKICEQLFKLTNNAQYLEQAFYFSAGSKATILQRLTQINRSLYENYSDQKKLAYEQSKKRFLDLQRKVLEENNPNQSLLEEYSQVQMEHERIIKDLDFSIELDHTHQIPSIADLQKTINRNTGILDAFVGDEYVYFFLISKNEFHFQKVLKQEFETNVKELKSLLNDPSHTFDKSLSQSIYKLICGESDWPFENIQEIVFIPDGFLNGFPLEVLVDHEQEYFIKSHQVSYAFAPLISNLNKKQVYTKEFVGFATNYSAFLTQNLQKKGVSVSSSSFGKLEKADEELRICASLFDSDIFSEEESTVSNFIENAHNSKILYLSLHGIADKDNGSNSFLVFDDHNGDFLLHGFQIQQQYLGSDLVVMSACHTADGRFHQGEGINGLTRAFLASGSRNIVSSFWAASENASIQILPDFLQNVQNGKTKSSALQNAKVRYLENNPPSLQHPFYWANYILFKNIENEKRDNNLRWYFILIPMIIASLLYLIFIAGAKSRKNKS